MTQPRVWLFTREPESVRLWIQPGPAGFQLVIVGPGSTTAEFDFAEIENLDRFREKYEQDLQARGFEPQSEAERRRAAADPAAPPPPPAERRR